VAETVHWRHSDEFTLRIVKQVVKTADVLFFRNPGFGVNPIKMGIAIHSFGGMKREFKQNTGRYR